MADLLFIGRDFERAKEFPIERAHPKLGVFIFGNFDGLLDLFLVELSQRGVSKRRLKRERQLVTLVSQARQTFFDLRRASDRLFDTLLEISNGLPDFFVNFVIAQNWPR